MDKYWLDKFVHFRLSGQILDKYLLDKMILNIKVCCFVLFRVLLNKTEQTTKQQICYFVALLNKTHGKRVTLLRKTRALPVLLVCVADPEQTTNIC